MPHALVTGGSGFIGRHLVAELLRHDWDIRCLVRPTSRVDHLRHPRIQLCQRRLDSTDELRAAVADVDTVFHLAGLTDALNKKELFEVNGTACGALAEACCRQSNPPVLVYVSSLAAAGPAACRGAIRRESDAPHPISNYGKSKRLGEAELQRRAADVPCTIVRPGIVFGSHDPGLAMMFQPIYRYRLHITVGYRTPPLSLIHVSDLVQLILRAGEHGERLPADLHAADPSQGFYFASDDGEFPTYSELGRRLARALNCRVLVWPLWRWAGRSVGGICQLASWLRGRSSLINLDKVREATACSWACSSAKARQQLAFRPSTDLDTALKHTAGWYLEHEWI